MDAVVDGSVAVTHPVRHRSLAMSADLLVERRQAHLTASVPDNRVQIALVPS